MAENIEYFDNIDKILSNITRCMDKDEPNIHLIHNSIKSLVDIIKTQNSLIKELISDKDKNINCVENPNKILVGMFCYINNSKKYGKIIEITDENCKIQLLDSNEIMLVSKSKTQLI